MSKKESKFSKIDLIIIIFCFTGACFCGAAFWGAYNNTLEKLNEEPVGTIIFQRRVAQRRFIDRNVWDRLRLASLVYNGDTIRTIEQSEAIIILGDETTHLNMGESTMIQVFFDNRSGTQIDFSGGNLDVLSENTSIAITSGTSTIVVEGQARMERSEEGFVLSVLEGTANFDGMEMETGSILALDSEGEISTNPIIAMTSFGSSAYVLGVQGESTAVVFSWNQFYFNPDTYVIVEIAEDRRFSRMVETRDTSPMYGNSISSISIPLENGSYWWRAYPASDNSRSPINSFFPSGTLEIIPVSPVVLLSPAHRGELVSAGTSGFTFFWSSAESASSYLVEISARADMSAPVVSRRVESNSITQEGLGFGRWYWRVTPVFPSHIRGAAKPSVIGEFSIVRIPNPPPIFFGANIENWNNLDPRTIADNNRILSNIVQLLNSNSELKIRVEGHANPVSHPSDAIGRQNEQIQFLQPMSEQRAKTIVDLLVQLGVDPNQLEFCGLGSEHPLAAWEDSRNWWRNRRVEFVVVE